MKTKRITANLPQDLLEKALAESHAGITETIIEGLELLLRRNALKEAQLLKGKIQMKIDEGRKDGDSSR